MKYKIVFFDIDGTLVDENSHLPQSTIHAVKELRTKGLQVVLATGRSPIHIKNVAKKLNVNAYVCCNGSIVRYEGEKIFSESIPQETIEQLMVKAEQQKHPLIHFTENSCYSNVDIRHHVNTTFENMWDRLPAVQPDIWKQENVYQMYLYCQEEDKKIYEKSYPRLKFTKMYPSTVDVNDRYMNKSINKNLILREKSLLFLLKCIFI